jgi:F-type H+-transporting ATPase subunit b
MSPYLLLAEGGNAFMQTVDTIAKTFGVDWAHLIAQIISFSLVAFLLYKFAYQRVLATLEERRQRIAESLANADKIKQELLSTEEQRQEILTKANEQANRLIEEARAAAGQVRERETQRAIAAAEEIISKAREAAELDHARMLAELKRELGHLVVITAAIVTGKTLTPEDQRRLVEETIRQLVALRNED